MEQNILRRVFVLAVSAAAVWFWGGGRSAPWLEATDVTARVRTTARAEVSEDLARLMRRAEESGSVSVIVEIKPREWRSARNAPETARALDTSAFRKAQQAVLAELGGLAPANVKLFKYIPFAAMEVGAAQLSALSRSSLIAGIHEDLPQTPFLVQSNPLIGAPAAYTAGFDGTGRAVAIVDSGVDKVHPFFNNRVVSEACYSTTGSGTMSTCPGGAAQSTASGSGVNCANSISGCDHGTHIAGIAAGGNPAIIGSGIAKNASIISIKVASSTTSCGAGPSPCTVSLVSDTILGLERVYELRTSFNIDAVNLSMGTGQYFGNCDVEQPAYKAAIDNLAAARIATVAASGNNGWINAMSAPACISSAVGVGSSDDGNGIVNTVSPFSNSAAFLGLLAPGDLITSAVPGGSYDNKAGTSQAAAHVTGSWAILRQKFPNDTVAQSLARFRNSGLAITDSRNGVVKRRIHVGNALNAAATFQSDPFDFDGDGRADFSVFRPSSGAWYLQRSTAGFQGLQFGANGDKLAPADYDGDGKTDIAVYRPSAGRWYILNSATSTVTYPVFGVAEDLPAPGDYDGDGKADINVFRPSQGTWYRQNSSNGSFFGFQFGANGDVPTIGDFDGDTKNDLGIFRPSVGDWYHIRSSNGSVFGERFGQTGDKIAPADYDGDGKTDIAIYRPSTGLWVVRNSATATYSYYVFGAPTDIPISGDYDGDGKTDIGVWRPSDGTWYIQRSFNSQFIVFPWGQNGDAPTPGAFGN